MSENLAVLVVLPLVALFLMLAAAVLIVRGKKPLSIRLRGFGVNIEIAPRHELRSRSTDNIHQN